MQLAHERFVPIRAEGVPIAESIASDLVAGHEQNRRALGFAIVKHGASTPKRRSGWRGAT
jgi:hypothetical protein